MTTTTATVDALPADAWPTIARCLTGAELFNLARASRWTWRSFSHDDFWRHRLAPDDAAALVAHRDERHDTINTITSSSNSNNSTASSSNRDNDATSALVAPIPTALRMYMRAFSLKLEGLPKTRASQGSGVALPQFYDAFVAQRTSLSFDVWFCLLDGSGTGDVNGSGSNTNASSNTSSMYTGGVLFGGQSTPFGSSMWPHYHQQFALVSADRKLYCSVLSKKPKIASDLALERWYHLALTYENALQHVYLDGALVSSLTGPLHHEWWHMTDFQVGSGCITAGELCFPRPSACGWYPFNGLVDDFRVWQRALSHDEVRVLARGATALPPPSDAPLYALKRDLAFFPAANATQVGCSRPHERVAVTLSGGARAFRGTAETPRASRAARGDRSRWQQQRRARDRRS